MDGIDRKSNILVRSLIFISLILLCFKVQSAERYEFYNGIRSLGMGGVSIGVVNDETALLINPAALGRLRDYFITVADPEIEINSNFQGILSYDILSGIKPQTVLNAMNPGQTAKYLHMRAQVFPSLVLPNFGMGFIGKVRMDAELDASLASFMLDYQKDYGFVMGFNFRLFDGKMKLGFNTRVINRTEIKRTDIPGTTTDLGVNTTYAKEGIGIGTDVGLVFTAAVKMLPSIALVARDVGGTKYSFRNGLFLTTTEKPDTTPMTVDVALSLSPIIGKKTRSTLSLEYRDVLYDDTTNGAEAVLRRIHVGWEVNFFDSIFLRLGANQGYWTTGFEMAFNNYQLQISSYGEEIGSLDGSTKREDRRYALKFSYRF